MKQYKIWKHLSMAMATALVITACGGGGTTNSGAIDNNISTPTGLDRIEEYAQNGGTAPRVEDYIDAGITDISIANLTEINTVVLGLVAEDVDTVEEVQLLVNELGEEVTVPINPNPTPVTEDTTAPSFTSSATASVNENQTSAITLKATDSENVVIYSISGGESDSFLVNPTTGVVTFKVAPDYETLTTYRFTATATDSADNAVMQDVTLTITDIVEGQAPKKTGQTKSYDASGAEVTDGSLKDDGFYQKGTSRNYTRDDTTDIVTDHITGLEWHDDSNVSSAKKQWLTTTNYDICRGQNGQTKDSTKCMDTSGDTATNYCTDLMLGGHNDWRLPTTDELMYIVDKSKDSPTINTSYFENVSYALFISGQPNKYYWSSTTFVGREELAWFTDFYRGNDGADYKYSSNYVRCVRDGK